MRIISESGMMTRAASVDIVTYFHDELNEGVVERPVWTLALWLSTDIAEARLGYGEGDLPLWPAAGAISLIPPGVPLRLHVRDGYIRSITCRYQPDIFESLTGLDVGAAGVDVARLLDLQGRAVAPLRTCLHAIAGELSAPGHGSAVLVESLCVEAAVHLARAILDGGGGRGDPALGRPPVSYDPSLPPGITQRFAATGGLTPRQLRIVADHAERLATGRGSIADLARACGISASHLSRAFKQSTGQTLRHHLENTRLRIARELLSQTAEPIGDIARAVGFAHAGALSIAFKRTVGVSPRTYRQRSGLAPPTMASSPSP